MEPLKPEFCNIVGSASSTINQSFTSHSPTQMMFVVLQTDFPPLLLLTLVSYSLPVKDKTRAERKYLLTFHR